MIIKQLVVEYPTKEFVRYILKNHRGNYSLSGLNNLGYWKHLEMNNYELGSYPHIIGLRARYYIIEDNQPHYRTEIRSL